MKLLIFYNGLPKSVPAAESPYTTSNKEFNFHNTWFVSVTTKFQ